MSFLVEDNSRRANDQIGSSPKARGARTGDRQDEFRAECLEDWRKVIAEVAGPTPPASMSWHGLYPIQGVLRTLRGLARNYAFHPTGGGNGFDTVETAAESGCLRFSGGRGLVHIVKPRALTLEHFAEASQESFLLLELDELEASGVYEHPGPTSEEVLELPSGDYMSRNLLDLGYLGYDENGREVPLPPDARLVIRWFGGKILIVARASLWNRNSATWDGRHNKMEAAQIRAVIKQELVCRPHLRGQ